MSIQQLLQTTNHRPWQIPSEKWKFYQEWNKTIFLHWKVDLNELQKFVPKELEIDLFEGSPWISLVAFTMEKIRPRYLPAFPPISNFDEINIRTYVKSKNKTGVYFLSIEGGNSISCKIAKEISKLPYRFSQIKRTATEFNASNLTRKDQLAIDYSIGKDVVSKTALDVWLTERYALYQDTTQHINAFEIHHFEWEIKEIEINELHIDYKRFDKLLIGPPVKAQYSDGVKVIAWGKNKYRKTSFHNV